MNADPDKKHNKKKLLRQLFAFYLPSGAKSSKKLENLRAPCACICCPNNKSQILADPAAQVISASRRNSIMFTADQLRAYPNNRVVMRPSEKFEAKAAGQKCSEAWFSPR